MSSPTPAPNLRFGVIGAGQLALYLVRAARRLGAKTVVVGDSLDDPALAEGDVARVGRLNDLLRSEPALAHDTRWTFENEFLDVRGLESLDCRPALSVLSILRNKKHQKKLLDTLGIPTAPWLAKEELESDETFLDRVTTRFGAIGYVLKWGEGGYDGKGTFLASAQRGRAEALTFLSGAREVYAEARVDFADECAIVAVRGQRGQVIPYPLVQSEQEDGICRFVAGSAKGHFPLEFEATARKWIEQILTRLDYVGCLAVEMFLDRAGSLFVNEIAPRVHNTAHYSLDACVASQFENHVRAVLDLELIMPQPAPAFGMMNLLGPAVLARAYRIDASDPRLAPKLAPGLTLHWYGKRDVKARRKLGHINFVAPSQAAAPRLAALARSVVLDLETRLAHPTPEGDSP